MIKPTQVYGGKLPLTLDYYDDLMSPKKIPECDDLEAMLAFGKPFFASKPSMGGFSIPMIEVGMASLHDEWTTRAAPLTGHFRFKIIDTVGFARELGASFETEEDGENWNILSTLMGRLPHGDMDMVAVKLTGSDTYAGFLMSAKEVCLTGGENRPWGISYYLATGLLYVRPGARGLGYSSALRRVLVRDVAADFSMLAKLVDKGMLDKFEGFETDFTVHSEPSTEEGIRFLDNLVHDIEEVLDDMLGEDRRIFTGAVGRDYGI